MAGSSEHPDTCPLSCFPRRTLNSMRVNKLRQKLAAGGKFISGWVNCGNPLVVEAMANAGFDAVTLDMQHGELHSGNLITALQAVSTTDAVPLVRVPWNHPPDVMKALDFGAQGVICPLIETPEAAAAFVAACRYPPLGGRSYGPVRAGIKGGADYYSYANEMVMAIPMIETKLGLQNLGSILEVPGIDAIFVGPSDLAQSLGQQIGPEYVDGVVFEALAQIVQTCSAKGVPVGVYTNSVGYARRMLELGFSFVTAGSDLGYVRAAAADVVAQLRRVAS